MLTYDFFSSSSCSPNRWERIMSAVVGRDDKWQCLRCGLLHREESSAHACTHLTCPDCGSDHATLEAAKECVEAHEATTDVMALPDVAPLPEQSPQPERVS